LDADPELAQSAVSTSGAGGAASSRGAAFLHKRGGTAGGMSILDVLDAGMREDREHRSKTIDGLKAWRSAASARLEDGSPAASPLRTAVASPLRTDEHAHASGKQHEDSDHGIDGKGRLDLSALALSSTEPSTVPKGERPSPLLTASSLCRSFRLDGSLFESTVNGALPASVTQGHEHDDRIISAANSADDASAMSENDLVALLRMKPKYVPQLHSRESFRRFFRCLPHSYMEQLLRMAFVDMTAAELEDKVSRRMALLAP
jgi:hypothetical protein